MTAVLIKFVPKCHWHNQLKHADWPSKLHQMYGSVHCPATSNTGPELLSLVLLHQFNDHSLFILNISQPVPLWVGLLLLLWKKNFCRLRDGSFFGHPYVLPSTFIVRAVTETQSTTHRAIYISRLDQFSNFTSSGLPGSVPGPIMMNDNEVCHISCSSRWWLSAVIQDCRSVNDVIGTSASMYWSHSASPAAAAHIDNMGHRQRTHWSITGPVLIYKSGLELIWYTVYWMQSRISTKIGSNSTKYEP